MPDEPSSSSTDETTETGKVDEESTESPGAEESPGGEDENSPGESSESEGGESDELDLDAAKAALAKVRKSEAKTRTRLRELEAKLQDAKTPEEIEAIKSEAKQESAAEARDLLVENVALKHDLPAELAELLKGDTREELETHAKKLAKFAPAKQSGDPDLEGGLEPGKSGDATEEAMRKEMADLQRRRRGY